MVIILITRDSDHAVLLPLSLNPQPRSRLSYRMDPNLMRRVYNLIIITVEKARAATRKGPFIARCIFRSRYRFWQPSFRSWLLKSRERMVRWA